MNPFEAMEKLITERGSAEILKVRLELAKEQYDALEKKVDEGLSKIGRLESEVALERSLHRQAKETLTALQKEYEEEIRIVQGIEFRKGKRTNLVWDVFCPKCQMPAYGDGNRAFCTAGCGWHNPNLSTSLGTLVEKANAGGLD